MKKENELAIFGFVETKPLMAGTWKAKVMHMIETFEGTPLERAMVERFAEVTERMRKSALANALRILDIEL